MMGDKEDDMTWTTVTTFPTRFGMQLAWNLLLLTAGSCLCALGINGILIPHRFLSGGFAGLSLIFHYLFPQLSVGLLYLGLNIPVFFLGYKHVGRRFFLYSLAGMVIFALAADTVHVSFPVTDPVPAALLSGIIMGGGAGTILRSLGSAGGADILGVILLKRYSVSLGSTVLAFNCMVLGLSALIFPLDLTLYTLAYLFVAAQMTNLVVTGLSRRKAVLIISDEWESISRAFLNKRHRGITIIEGRGAWGQTEKHLLYTVVAFRDLPQLKQLIRSLDPDAFVVINDTREIMGQRLGTEPRW